MTNRQPSRAATRPDPHPLGWRLVLTAFFLSGFAGLMHQVVWSKLLVGLIGATAYAQAAVLAVFMGGLALGAALFGWRVDRRGGPLKTYVVLEILIGVYCLLLPLLLDGLGLLYLALAPGVFESSGLRLLLRFVLAIGALLFPAVLMGATLPVLARHLIATAGETQRSVASLYGLNSLGAVIGAGAAGFLTLPLLGTYPSLATASGLNLVAAALVVPAARREAATQPRSTRDEPGAGPPDPEPTLPSYGANQYVVTLVALALSGFAAMGYEVLFIRVISLSFGLSVYSFTVMLMSFITGISLGSLIVSRVQVRHPLWLLGLSQLAVVGALLAVTPLIERFPYLMGLIRIQAHDARLGFELYQLGKAALCLAVLLLPTTCLGFCFPLVAHIQARRSPRIGGHVGSTYAWNTVGNVVGTIVTSLVLLPALGLLGAFHFNFALNLVAGVALLLVAREVGAERRLAAGALAVVVCAIYVAEGTGWLEPMRFARNHLRMSAPPPGTETSHPSASFDAWKQSYVALAPEESTLYFEEDSHATVLAHGDARQIVLLVDGKPDASTFRDLPLQMFLAHFPLMLNPQAQTLLVIGHGSGITAGSALRHPVQRADIVEISRGVLNADSVFAEFNYHVLEDPRVRVYEEDGQSFLRSTRRRYDVIISEPSNPWIAGMAGLFTVEFFESVRSRLNPGGVAAIWLHEYEQSLEGVELVLRTLRSVFPHVQLARSHDYTDVIAVASVDRIEPDFAAIETRYEEPAIRNDLARLSICNLMGLLMHHSLSESRLEEILPPGPLNTVGRPRLEYSAPRAFFRRAGAKFLVRHDPLFQGRELDTDGLLSRYMEYRVEAGEPVSREELEDVAATALQLGLLSQRVAQVFMRLAAEAAPRAQPPTRPARGSVPAPGTMEMFEARYWAQRFASEGKLDVAQLFVARFQELMRAAGTESR